MEKCPSSRLSYRFLVTFLPKKQHLSPPKNVNSPSVRDEKKISATVSPLDRDLCELSENSLRPAAWAFCGNSRRRSFTVWITIGGELENHGCGFYASSPGSSSLRRCIGGELVNHLWCYCGISVWKGLLIVTHRAAFSHRETGSCFQVSRFRFWYVCRYSPNNTNTDLILEVWCGREDSVSMQTLIVVFLALASHKVVKVCHIIAVRLWIVGRHLSTIM